MKMKGYAVRLNFYGTTTVFVTAPDDEEGETVALEEAQNMDFNDLDIEFEIESTEEDNDES
jgi:hypothetical protein